MLSYLSPSPSSAYECEGATLVTCFVNLQNSVSTTMVELPIGLLAEAGIAPGADLLAFTTEAGGSCSAALRTP